MYIILLKPDQPEALPVRIDERGGPQNGNQALYMTSHLSTGGDFRIYKL